jgi:hypothetical protein
MASMDGYQEIGEMTGRKNHRMGEREEVDLILSYRIPRPNRGKIQVLTQEQQSRTIVRN